MKRGDRLVSRRRWLVTIHDMAESPSVVSIGLDGSSLKSRVVANLAVDVLNVD
jgi:hypothetical protein